MECNQNSNPLDYSQSSVVYKEVNANGNVPVTASIQPNPKSNDFFDQNSMKSPSVSAISQVIVNVNDNNCVCLAKADFSIFELHKTGWKQ